MKNKVSALFVVALVIGLAPLAASAKKKAEPERAMVEKMDAVPCGAKERGVSGFGTLWASAGITHINSDEKLCPQYELKTDEKDYEIRPTDGKNPVLLPVGHEAVFKIKNNVIVLSVPDSDDRKTRTYKVVAVRQINTDSNQPQSSDAATAKP
jgi:hypothetical protein